MPLHFCLVLRSQHTQMLKATCQRPSQAALDLGVSVASEGGKDQGVSLFVTYEISKGRTGNLRLSDGKLPCP